MSTWIEVKALEPTGEKIVAAECGCYACNEEIQEGHGQCSTPPDWALSLEAGGVIYRHYDGVWRWFLDAKLERLFDLGGDS